MENQEILNEYEAAMFAANGAGYAGMTAEQVIRNLVERAEAAEAKLAEMEKQEPYAFGSKWTDMKTEGSHFSGSIFNNAWGDYTKPLFTLPAPAINLAELVPDETPKNVYQVIYQECGGFVESNANAQTIWKACRAAILRNIEDAK